MHRLSLLLLFTIICCVSAHAAAPVTSGTLPVLHIATEGGAEIASKTEYLPATYWLEPMGTVVEADTIGSEAEPLPMKIRGRGHSSWKGDKKPYKIKLEKKASLAGMAANKHWALLKPTEHTVAGMELGRLSGMAWTPDFRPVEVVLNGDYLGLYFLTESVRIHPDRVDIYEQADGETAPELISGGWLVEIDNYSDTGQFSFSENDRWRMKVKYHSPEVLSAEQLQWITAEFKAMNAAIYSSDKRSTAWEEYMDVESMARFFIVQEVMDNPDGFHGSFYLHKDLGDDARWTAGPLWDPLCYFRQKTDYTFMMKAHYSFTPHWIGEIIQYPSFCNAVGRVWADIYPSALSTIYDYIDSTLLPLDRAWTLDCQRWNGNPDETVWIRADRIKSALRGNMDWLDRNLPQSQWASTIHAGQSASAIQGPVTVYTIQGIRVGEYADEAQATSSLRPGLYIINGQKILID